jgi:catechol 2,3-dioxygenase-like lactoylglutathione lyase family enzyme
LPVLDLEESLAWYQDVFGFKMRWQNNRMAGLTVGSNVGFHLVKVREWEPSDKYTPINLAAIDAEAVRVRLKEKHVRLSDWRPGEPVRFDFWDNTGNIISLIQL